MSLTQQPYTQVGVNYRVEKAAARKQAIATEELLDNKVTSPHYREGRPDALGKPIAIGEEMDYHDFLGNPVYRVYERHVEEAEVTRWVDGIPTKNLEEVERYKIVAEHSEEDDALADAQKRAGINQ